MNYNFESITKELNKKGFFIMKNFLSKSDLDKNFINYLNKKEKFVDGVIHGLDTKFYVNINKKIKKISQSLCNKDLNISNNKFCYASIRIKKTTNSKTTLIKPFNIFKDPKVSPGGGIKLAH